MSHVCAVSPIELVFQLLYFESSTFVQLWRSSNFRLFVISLFNRFYRIFFLGFVDKM